MFLQILQPRTFIIVDGCVAVYLGRRGGNVLSIFCCCALVCCYEEHMPLPPSRGG